MGDRIHKPLRLAVLGLLAALPLGCGGRTIEIKPGDGLVEDGAPAVMIWSDWGLTLSRAVVGDRIDYAGLLEDRRSLDRFLWRVARVGPRTSPAQFPDRDSRLAYAINCYNAAILRSVTELARDGALPRAAPFALERRFRFRIDGRFQSPADLRRTAEALAGDDWRVRFALSDGRQTGPPLARRVFLGDLLDAQLNQVTRSALSSRRVVRIDHGERKRLLVWRGLYDIRDRLVREHEARLRTKNAGLLNVLLKWSDQPRRELLNTAVGYEVALLPTDARLNALEPASDQDRGILSVFKVFRSVRFLGTP